MTVVLCLQVFSYRVIVNTEIQDFGKIKDFLGFDGSWFGSHSSSTASYQKAIVGLLYLHLASLASCLTWTWWNSSWKSILTKMESLIQLWTIKVFENTEIIKNPKYKITVEQHMGKHPVFTLTSSAVGRDVLMIQLLVVDIWCIMLGTWLLRAQLEIVPKQYIKKCISSALLSRMVWCYKVSKEISERNQSWSERVG